MMHLRPIHIWLILIAASLLSWLLTEDTQAAKWGATGVILIAALKVNLVVAHFMELKWQPAPYRFVLLGWILLVTSIIIGGYLAV
jgi:predicted membrane channel-forming protein YqfA (hemolysin III family)